MSSLCLLAASLVVNGEAPGWQLALPPSDSLTDTPTAQSHAIAQLCQSSLPFLGTAIPIVAHHPEFSHSASNAVALSESSVDVVKPRSGGQLYQQRVAALRAGKLYTRLPADSFWEQWRSATRQPTYEEWKNLLAHEAKAVARGQGSTRLTVILGDSLALWYPTDRLPRDRLWLNQGISGDTTAGVMRRLSVLDETRPDVIHVVAGINDLRKGATDAEVISNLRQIMGKLRQAHPQAQILVHSILPTRLAGIPASRIRWLNYNIAAATQREGVNFVDLQPAFADASGSLRRPLTTDGLHLSPQGYDVWRSAMSPIL
jgi:lysophospholipase L1-like esterase